jgi:sugar lactone lactonase YvrE
MVMDRNGTNLYFGSQHELMYFSVSSNTLSKQDPTVPGVVLAVSPSNAQLLINDQVRQVFYLYSIASSSATTFGGMGNAAAWTPDSKTLYITDSAALGGSHTDTLYVYNVNTGWTTYPLASSGAGNPGAQNLAITIPSVGAFLSGNPTVAHTWCPSGTVGDTASMLFYPQGPTPDNSVNAETDVLAATTDGNHILGASTSGGGITLSDIGVTIPAFNCLPPSSDNNPLALGDPLSPMVLGTTLNQTQIAATATAVNQVVASPASTLAFITYNGTAPGASLPYYVPGSNGAAGTVGYVTLGGSSAAAITAPLAGAFTPDDALFFVSTAGDNLIHYISIPPKVTPATPPVDTQQIAPNLPACTPVSAGGNDVGCTYTGSGSIVPATAIVVKPRSTT